MAITRLTKHDSHQVQIHLTKTDSKHYSALRCRNCNKHIQWLSKTETDNIRHMGVKVIQPWANKEELGI